MKFPENNHGIKPIVTKNIFNDIMNLVFGNVVIYHSHVRGKIIGYAHDFCNKKLREMQNLIPVFAYNPFNFDFFFVVK